MSASRFKWILGLSFVVLFGGVMGYQWLMRTGGLRLKAFSSAPYRQILSVDQAHAGNIFKQSADARFYSTGEVIFRRAEGLRQYTYQLSTQEFGSLIKMLDRMRNVNPRFAYYVTDDPNWGHGTFKFESHGVRRVLSTYLAVGDEIAYIEGTRTIPTRSTEATRHFSVLQKTCRPAPTAIADLIKFVDDIRKREAEPWFADTLDFMLTSQGNSDQLTLTNSPPDLDNLTYEVPHWDQYLGYPGSDSSMRTNLRFQVSGVSESLAGKIFEMDEARDESGLPYAFQWHGTNWTVWAMSAAFPLDGLPDLEIERIEDAVSSWRNEIDSKSKSDALHNE